eukprot:gb/GECG01014630.1/.p1 GENE.gb/GECG01014630.1/~~gb/GECG01014630.1/.p1  ORF type:complete len:348 (+),score=60.37 gb/GECG01014630.1/:1-1044(+)
MGNCSSNVTCASQSEEVVLNLGGNPTGLKGVQKKYEINKQIGRGHYGNVYAGNNKKTGKEVAIKILKRSKSRPHRLKLEVDILRKIGKHPNVVELYEIFEDKENVILVSELLHGGELFERIVAHGPYKEKYAAKLFIKLTQTVRFLHQQSIVHRDLKPENLLMTTKGADAEIKLTDFGLSRLLTGGRDAMSTVCGTWAYSAPEVKIFRKTYSHMVDLWSLGILLYVMLAGYHPFDPEGNAAEEVLQQNIKQGKYDFDDPEWEHVSDSAKDLIGKLIQLQPENRLDTDGVLQHPWILKYHKPLNVKTSSASFESTELRSGESPPPRELQQKKNDAFGVNGSSTRRKKK